MSASIYDYMPPGTLADLASKSGLLIPDGWLMCYGQAISRTQYVVLWLAIGSYYGSGNGTTTFNIPDFRGRIAAAPDGGTGRLPANYTLGAAFGNEYHVLAISEMPEHVHSYTSFQYTGGGLQPGVHYPAITQWTGYTGGGAPHNNVQPGVTGIKIIKY